MTPQQLKAMKLALEALELINIEFVCRNGSHHKKEDRHEWDEDCPITNRWRKAITAIKEALAEHAMQEVQRLGQEIEQEPVVWADYESKGIHHKPVAWMDADGNVSDNNDHKCFPIPLYTTPPQRTEQEPVAWGVFEGNLHDMFFTQEEAQEMADLKGSHAEVKPFYTHPPQRTWVDLTDTQI